MCGGQWFSIVLKVQKYEKLFVTRHFVKNIFCLKNYIYFLKEANRNLKYGLKLVKHTLVAYKK